MRLGFQIVTDVRDPSTGLPSRQQLGAELPPDVDLPSRQSAARPARPAGRHRRAVPVSLPEAAPALVLAVPGNGADNLTGAAAELATVLSLDNPSVDVKVARIEGGGRADPSGIRAVLGDASARRPAGAPCAVVVPLFAAPYPAALRKLREAIAASEVNAVVRGFANANAMLAEVLHIRLAEAGLARADRVRLFSIVTAAEGVILATIGGADAVMASNVTSLLLAARLALPVLTASVDGTPSIAEATIRLKEMGASRLAVAPCVIGPELEPGDLDSAGLGVECAAPLGAHGNIAKLISLAYGQAIDQIEIPGEQP